MRTVVVAGILALANCAPVAGTTSASTFVLAPGVVETVHIEERQDGEYVLFTACDRSKLAVVIMPIR